MLWALEREFADFPGVRWTVPAGGLYVWLTFPPGLDAGPDSPLMRSALHEGVLYVPGRFCCPDESATRSVHVREARLTFGSVPLEQIGEAVRRLARAVGSVLVEQGA